MSFARTREAHVRTLHIGDTSHLGSSRCCAIRKSIKRSSPARQCFGLWSEPKAKAAGPSGRSRGRAKHNTLIIKKRPGEFPEPYKQRLTYLKKSLKKKESFLKKLQRVQIKATKTKKPKTCIKLLRNSIHQVIKISTNIIIVLRR